MQINSNLDACKSSGKFDFFFFDSCIIDERILLRNFNEMFSIQLLVVIIANERVTREVLFVNGYRYVGLMPLKITKMS